PGKSQVDLLVLDSTFVSYRGIARKKLASFWLTWPLTPLAGVLVSNEYSAEESLKANRVPVLVIADRKDQAVPFSCSDDFYPEIQAPKEFWVLDRGWHVGTFADPLAPYRGMFLQRVDSLQPRSSLSQASPLLLR